MAVTWNRENAAHLLRRAGFGGTPAEIDAFLARHTDVASAVAEVVGWKPSRKKPPNGNANDFDVAKEKQQLWWLKEMVKAKRPGDAAREKMVLFLHGFLCSGQSKQPEVTNMPIQNRLFRSSAKGDFKKLVRDFHRDAANLYFLDGVLNEASQDGVTATPNENFARELMELFTLHTHQLQSDGSDDPTLPNYTEADIRNLARILTGWNDVWRGVGYFDPDNWDGGQYDDTGDGQPDDITFFGITNNNFRIDDSDDLPASIIGTADDALEVIFTRTDNEGNNQVAMFLARELWEYYAYPVPEPGLKAVLASLASDFVAADFSLETILTSLFTHDNFYSDAAKSRHIKNPVDYVVQTFKTFGIKGNVQRVDGDDLVQFLFDMGMDLFEPPNVAGWPGGTRWITTGQLLARLDFARALADASRGSTRIRLKKLQGAGLPIGDSAADPQVVLDAVLYILGLDTGPKALNATQQASMLNYLTDEGALSTLDIRSEKGEHAELKVKGLISLCLQTAEYQVF